MSDLEEIAQDVQQYWQEFKGGLDQIGEFFSAVPGDFADAYHDGVAFIDETLSMAADEMTAIPSHLRTAADAWGEDGIVVGLRAATDHMQGNETDGTGYLGLVNVWTGKSAEAAGLMHRALVHAMDSSAANLPDPYDDDAAERHYSTEDLNIIAWGEVQRGLFMAQVLNDIADELEEGILEHLGNIWGAIGAAMAAIGVATLPKTLAAAASIGGAVVSWVVTIVGAVVAFIGFAVSVYNSLSAMYTEVGIMAGSRYGGMTSDLPNYGPEWAA